MKKLLVFILSLALVTGASVVTCPQKDAHRDAIILAVNDYIADEVKINDDVESWEFFMLGISGGLAKLVIDNELIVKNHFLYSEGYLSSPEDGSKRVSFGIFGHVFTVNKKQLKEIANDL